MPTAVDIKGLECLLAKGWGQEERYRLSPGRGCRGRRDEESVPVEWRRERRGSANRPRGGVGRLGVRSKLPSFLLTYPKFRIHTEH